MEQLIIVKKKLKFHHCGVKEVVIDLRLLIQLLKMYPGSWMKMMKIKDIISQLRKFCNL